MRPSTEEILEGRLNGEPLKVTEEAPATTEAPPATTAAGGNQGGYATFTDTSGKLTFEAPSAWEFNGNSTQDGLARALGGPEPPGLDRHLVGDRRRRVRPRDQATDPTTLLGDASANCQSKDDPQDFSNHGYIGKSQQWYQCDGEASFWNAIVQAPGGGQWIDVQVIFTTDADQAAVNHVIDTFAYTA